MKGDHELAPGPLCAIDFLRQIPCPVCHSSAFNIPNPFTGVVECDNPPCRFSRASERMGIPVLDDDVDTPLVQSEQKPALSGRWNTTNAERLTPLVEPVHRARKAE